MKSILKRLVVLVIIIQYTTLSIAQIAINNDNSTADPSAILDVKSTAKGVLVPRMTTTQRNMISNAAVGLLVFDTDTESFWFSGSTGWIELKDGSLSTLQDNDNDTKVQVEKTADEDVIRFEVGGSEYMNLQDGVLGFENTGGSVFIGKNAGINDNKTTLSNNVAIGEQALKDNVAGTNNTAIGFGALEFNQDTNNTAIGAVALASNISGQNNTAVGNSALAINTMGSANVALGYSAGFLNMGDENVFIGNYAGQSTAQKSRNVMIGHHAGLNNAGNDNIFLGYKAGALSNGNNLLYIENSNSNTPLIYGEFNNDFVQINGTLNINNAYALPTSDGSNNQYLKTDGNGNLSWATPTDNDNQSLALSNNTLSLTNGGSVNLSSYLDNTDNQTLSFSNNTLSLTNGGNVNLSGYLDNTDNQTLALNTSSNVLVLTNGGSVNLSNYLDNTDNQALSLSNNTLSLANGGSVNLSSYLDNTDNQTLSLSNNTLSLANGGSVSLSNYLDNTDNQTLSFSSNTLSLTNGGSVDLSSLSGSGTTTLIADGDNDTKIQVEESADEDVIRFDIAGSEVMTISKNANGVTLVETPSGSLQVTLFGEQAGESLTTGQFNTFMGKQAGRLTTTGAFNTFTGTLAGRNNKVGLRNSYFGYNAGTNATGNNNTFIGTNAGTNATGDGNVFLGYQSGLNETGDNKLYIANSNTSSPLIYGEFNSNFIRVNGAMEVTVDLTVNDDMVVTDDLIVNGDIRSNSNQVNVSGDLKVNGDDALVHDRKTKVVSGQIDMNGGINGNVSTSGSLANSGTGKNSTGTYTVTFNNGTFTNEPIVTVTAMSGSDVRHAVITNISTSSFTVKIYNANGILKDAEFNFIAIGDK